MPRSKKKISTAPVKNRNFGPSAEERDRIRKANEAKYLSLDKEGGVVEDETNERHSQPRKWLKRVAGIDAVTDGKVKEGITSAGISGQSEDETETRINDHLYDRNQGKTGKPTPNWLKHVEGIKAKIKMVGKEHAKKNAIGKGQANARRKVGNRAG